MTDELDPPQPTAGDRAYAAVQAGLNLAPYVGGSAVVLVDTFVGSPLSRRQERWRHVVADAIRDLQARHVNPDGDEFVTAVVHASRIALGTHLDEKIQMLKAAIINSALPDRPSDLLTLRWLRFVDELDTEHFVVLTYLRDPVGWYEHHGIPQQEYVMGGRRTILDDARLPVTAATLDVVLADLDERRLVSGGGLNGIVSGRGMWDALASSLGIQLLDFVTYIEPPGEETSSDRVVPSVRVG